LRKGAYDAVLVSAAAIHHQNLEVSGLEVLELNPREFVPRPAQGVLAWQTHRDDLPARRILKPLHHPDVTACTNVERRVLQLLGDAGQPSLGVFVERDATGNFHAFAAGEIAGAFRRVRLSQSTNFELAERLVERLR
jgi:hydroxymethylbilane synthase